MHGHDIEELTALNRDYVASVQNSNVKRFDEILAFEFDRSNPDKSLVDRAAFLKQTAVPVTIKNLQAHDVKIRIMGDFAMIHAAHQLHHGGRPAGERPLYRLLGEAERKMARGVGSRVTLGLGDPFCSRLVAEPGGSVALQNDHFRLWRATNRPLMCYPAKGRRPQWRARCG